jgi:uncharacterized protein (DUF1778 family)
MEIIRTKHKMRRAMAITRIDMRLDEEIKTKAEKASALLGLKSLTEYIVRLIDDNATQVIAQHESITVENDVFDRFMNACREARKPNKALLDAASFTKEQGIK